MPSSLSQVDVYFSEAAISTIVCRLVGDEVLRSHFLGDLQKGTLKRKHIAGKKSYPSSLFRKRLQLAISLVRHLACFDSRYCRKKSCLRRNGKNRGLCSLRDLYCVANICPAVCVFAISNQYKNPTAGSRSHLLITELPDCIVKRRMRT